jgi:hypothetical protein
MRRRTAAIAALALLLSACGASGHAGPPAAQSSPAGGGTPATGGSQASPGQTPPKAQPPASTGQKPGGVPSWAAERHALTLASPKEITLAYNGLDATFRPGDSFVLRLAAPAGWTWKVTSFDRSVLARSAGPAGTQGTFRVIGSGTASLRATETPPCGTRCPDGASGPSFTLGVRAVPAGNR